MGTGFPTRDTQQLRYGFDVDKNAEAPVCSTGFAVLTPGPSAQPKYVSYLVQSNTFTDRVTAESVGTAYAAIAEGRLGSFYIPSPSKPPSSSTSMPKPPSSTLKLDAAIAAARRELLREYRERLICRCGHRQGGYA